MTLLRWKLQVLLRRIIQLPKYQSEWQRSSIATYDFLTLLRWKFQELLRRIFKNYTTPQISVRVAEITKFVTLIVFIRASLLICSCHSYNHCCCCPLLPRILWHYQLIYKNCRFYWKCISYKGLENLVVMHLFLWWPVVARKALCLPLHYASIW